MDRYDWLISTSNPKLNKLRLHFSQSSQSSICQTCVDCTFAFPLRAKRSVCARLNESALTFHFVRVVHSFFALQVYNIAVIGFVTVTV